MSTDDEQQTERARAVVQGGGAGRRPTGPNTAVVYASKAEIAKAEAEAAKAKAAEAEAQAKADNAKRDDTRALWLGVLDRLVPSGRTIVILAALASATLLGMGALYWNRAFVFNALGIGVSTGDGVETPAASFDPHAMTDDDTDGGGVGAAGVPEAP